MSKIQINSIKILSGKKEEPSKVSIEYTEHFEDGSSVVIPGEFDRPPHQDFKTALENLTIHLPILTSFLTEKQASDPAILEAWSMNGIAIKGDNRDGVVLKGQFTGKYGPNPVNTKTFFFGGEASENYSLSEHLKDGLHLVLDEGLLYIGGKREPIAQQSLQFPDDNGKSTIVKVLKPASEDNVTLAHIKAMKGKQVVEQEAYDLDGIKYEDKDEYERAKIKADKKADKKANGKKRVAQSAANPSGVVK